MLRSEAHTAGQRGFHFLLDLFGSGRPATSGIAGFLVATTTAFLPHIRWTDSIASGLAFTCITMMGFVFNDVHDIDKDRMKLAPRPITTGRVSKRQALAYCFFLIGLSGVLTPRRGTTLGILLATAFAVIAYSYFAYRFPTLKGVYTALLCATPLAYGAVVGRGYYPTIAYVVLFLFVLGREAYLDVLDLEEDQCFGLRTLPVRIGPETARVFGEGLMLFSGVSSLLIVRSPFGYLAAGSSILLLLSIFLWPKVDPVRRIRLTRIPMTLGALAVASSIWVQ